MVPVNSLPARINVLRSAKLPSHAGIVPDIRFFQRLSDCNLVRFFNSDGIVPVNWFSPCVAAAEM